MGRHENKMIKSIKIFISYAHEDDSLREELDKHLSLLKSQQLIDVWYDRDISAGTEWEQTIDKHLNTTQIILLLVSPDFMASSYCYSIEMIRAMERHEAEEARVIPVILRPVLWKSGPLGKLQALPTNAEPVTSRHWHTLDEAFLNVVEGIRKAVEELTTQQSLPISSSPSTLFTQIVMPIGLPHRATFVGRDVELRELMAQLRAGETTGIYALNGMGGVGKTALAAEVVVRLSQDRETFPGGAAWIPCEGLTETKGLYEIWRRVARAIQQDLVVDDPEMQRFAVATALAQFPRLLLALDNVEPQLDAETLIDTLAIPNHTTLLLTARQAIAPEKLTSLTLPPLSVVDATKLFVQRLKQRDGNRPTLDDEKWIPPIVDTLGGLPLAIELVAAYAGGQGSPLTQIIWELEQDKVEATPLNFDSRRALVSRFDRSWAVLSPTGQRLFAGLSLLRGSDFPRGVAIDLAFASMDEHERLIGRVEDKEGVKEVGTVAKNLRLLSQRHVANLVDYALVEPLQEQRLRLHPLLREYATKRLSEMSSDLRKDFEDVTNAFWRRYGREHPNYEGLTAVEAQNVWDANVILDHELTASQVTRPMLSLSVHASEVLRLTLHIIIHGDQGHARARILEGLAISKAGRDIKNIGLCYQYLALLDEKENNYVAAIQHYTEALHLFEPIHTQEANVVRTAIQRLREKAKGAPVITPRKKMPYLTHIRQGEESGHIYEIGNAPLRIGRSPEADIILKEPTVSRVHATLLPPGEGGYSIRDEGSTSGTWLNGQEINKHQIYPLHSGDTLQFGEAILIFTTHEL